MKLFSRKKYILVLTLGFFIILFFLINSLSSYLCLYRQNFIYLETNENVFVRIIRDNTNIKVYEQTIQEHRNILLLPGLGIEEYEKAIEKLENIALNYSLEEASQVIAVFEEVLLNSRFPIGSFPKDYLYAKIGRILSAIVFKNPSLDEDVFSVSRNIFTQIVSEGAYYGVRVALDSIIYNAPKVELSKRALSVLEDIVATEGLNSIAYKEIAQGLDFISRSLPIFISLNTVSVLENILNMPELSWHPYARSAEALGTIAQTRPELISLDTVYLLKTVFETKDQIQISKYISRALGNILENSEDLNVKREVINALEDIVTTSDLPPNIYLEVSAMLGELPLDITGPDLGFSLQSNFGVVTIDQLLTQITSLNPSSARFISRSLVYNLDDDKVLVIKLLKEDQNPETLKREAVWMEYLTQLEKEGHFSGIHFDIPELLKAGDSSVFKLQNIPIRIPKEINLHPEKYGIAFITSKDYFSYPNDNLPENRPSGEEFKEIISRSAFLFGYLTRLGIVHTDVIPLFHNRVQSVTREDGGLYQWWEGGRLDQWLFSCDYPNFGVTGIRDFEHMVSWDVDFSPAGYFDSAGLYHMKGTHLLSLLLTAGSYFRNADRSRVGLDQAGNPIDARDLFDRDLFKDIISNIFLEYYKGFTGRDYTGSLPFNLNFLTDRMIDEMGVDNHMVEILRISQQRDMNNEDFRDFFRARGYSESEIETLISSKGQQDIQILTGPHLGAFNGRISLPEMISAIEKMSALGILHSFKS